MRLTILGGGGFRTPHVFQALLRDGGDPRVDELVLHDTEAARLAVIGTVIEGLAAEARESGIRTAPRVTTTTSLEDAVRGTDFVFAAARVGGLEGRRADEHVALELGVLGQETTGPGGLAYALRTVPVMTEVAETIARLAPSAWVMNFTNPAGIVTEAMQRVLGDRVLGICDTPSGLARRAARALGVDPARTLPDYIGLNHLGWLRRLLVDGEDVLPRLIADDALLGGLEEGQIFGAPWIRALGAIPNEYLFYYDRAREALDGIRSAGDTRGDFLARTQGAFYAEVGMDAAGAVDAWRAAVEGRTASYMAEARGATQDDPGHRPDDDEDPAEQGYAGVAVRVMGAIARDERHTMILDVRNGGTIAGLPSDAVVEVTATIDANGPHPLSTPAPDLHQLGLMATLKSVERHVIEAATTGSREEALMAFAEHPLVDGVGTAEKLLDGYIARIPEVAAVFGR